MHSLLRLVFAILVLAATAIFFAKPPQEVFPPRLPLASFPITVANWQGTDIPIPKDVLETLGKGEFLLRLYLNTDQSKPTTDLFIAYFSSQRTGNAIHSPQNCLPGSGWTPIQRERIIMSVPGFSPFPVNRDVIAKGEYRLLVLYWYWAHNRGVASEYMAKYYLVADSIRMHRSDGSLVRITTPLSPGETAPAAEQRILPFASSVQSQLSNFVPR
jgi:EpsI family protein